MKPSFLIPGKNITVFINNTAEIAMAYPKTVLSIL